METRSQAHVSYRLMYHVVWIPKRRWKVLKSGVSVYCDKVIRSVGIQTDHIHVVLVVPSKYSISKVVGDIKRMRSKRLRDKFECLRRGRETLWAVGYYVSSVGLDESRVKKYVKHQQKEELGQLKAVWDKGATGKA